MCTLSWIRKKNCYQVFFNRDEQRTRQRAFAPQCIPHHDVKVLMPLDPDGGGSWICVNEYGVSLYLLNYYQGELASKELISRGQLLRSLSHNTNLKSIEQQLEAIDLRSFAPFTLVAFDSQLSSEKTIQSERAYQWNGQCLEMFQPSKLITSSSVKFEEVSQCRHQLYAEHITSGSANEHIAFHAGHDGDENYRSVCMHRADAKTVSFSSISVSSDSIEFIYHDGSPCQANAAQIREILPRNSN